MSQHVVDVFFRSKPAESKAQGANTFSFANSHCLEDVRHTVYACATSAAGGGFDLQGIQQHDEAISISTGERDVQVGRQARLGGIDHRVTDGGKDSVTQLFAERRNSLTLSRNCLLYTSDAADE